MIVAQQHHVDGGQLGHGQGRRGKPFRPEHLVGGRPVRKHRVCQHVQPVNLFFVVVFLGCILCTFYTYFVYFVLVYIVYIFVFYYNFYIYFYIIRL